jgi:hypothetical protein
LPSGSSFGQLILTQRGRRCNSPVCHVCHSLDVDATGDRLAMGSTTGGVWVTESGGDRWTQVPVRFTPVFAVRFW